MTARRSYSAGGSCRSNLGGDNPQARSQTLNKAKMCNAGKQLFQFAINNVPNQIICTEILSSQCRGPGCSNGCSLSAYVSTRVWHRICLRNWSGRILLSTGSAEKVQAREFASSSVHAWSKVQEMSGSLVFPDNSMPMGCAYAMPMERSPYDLRRNRERIFGFPD